MDDWQVLQVLPLRIREILKESKISMLNISEIRLRIGQPVFITYKNREFFLSRYQGLEKKKSHGYVCSKDDLRQAIGYMSNYSLYAYDQQLKHGYITVRGGHRIGVTGSVVLEKGEIKTLKHISCLNIRVAHEIKDCARKLQEICTKNHKLLPTLLVAPPGCGKTTMLRDLIRIISNGGQTVGVVDERSEIGAAYLGVPQNDLGMRTDILDGTPKAEGMNMLIRSMAPEVIAVDEIGSREDIDGIIFCANRGVTILATVHGDDYEGLSRHVYLKELIHRNMFSRYVIFDHQGKPGVIKEIINENGDVIYG